MASFTNGCVKLHPQLENMEQFNAVSSARCVMNPHFFMSGHARLPFSVSNQCVQTSMKICDTQGQCFILTKASWWIFSPMGRKVICLIHLILMQMALYYWSIKTLTPKGTLYICMGPRAMTKLSWGGDRAEQLVIFFRKRPLLKH